jgi:hypothetical protein
MCIFVKNTHKKTSLWDDKEKETTKRLSLYKHCVKIKKIKKK